MTNLRARIVGGVCAFWVLVAVVLGSQTALAGALQGSPTPLAPALVDAFIQNLPWIPVTLVVIRLATRFPVGRATWQRNLWLHVLAVPLLTFGMEFLVVLGFGLSMGGIGEPGAFFRSVLLWTALRIHVVAAVYLAIAALTQWVMVYRQMKARELSVARLEGQLARARLQALNAQIRPHFLFNTLHTIGQLWRSGRSDEADAMLDHLGALFQKVQATASEVEVPLAEELRMVEEYLAIEAARFPDRLKATVEAGPEAMRCLVPPLILQPLVENAIRHGVSVSSTAGKVGVKAWVEDGRLAVEVSDDGPGMNGSSPAAGTGTGLANTRERLEQGYGEDQKLEIRTPEEGGTVVRVELPAHD